MRTKPANTPDKLERKKTRGMLLQLIGASILVLLGVINLMSGEKLFGWGYLSSGLLVLLAVLVQWLSEKRNASRIKMEGSIIRQQLKTARIVQTTLTVAVLFFTAVVLVLYQQGPRAILADPQGVARLMRAFSVVDAVLFVATWLTASVLAREKLSRKPVPAISTTMSPQEMLGAQWLLSRLLALAPREGMPFSDWWYAHGAH